MNIEILEKLITEGEELVQTISYVPSGDNVIRTFSVYTSSQLDKYEDWQSAVLRFTKTFHFSDLDEVKDAMQKLSPKNHRKLLGILRAIKLLPIEPKKSSNNTGSTNNIQITNNQSVSQQMTLNVFLEAIKDELTGKQIKELKEVINDYEQQPEKTKDKLLHKIKGFGNDVLSNIVANIITNPTIYTGF